MPIDTPIVLPLYEPLERDLLTIGRKRYSSSKDASWTIDENGITPVGRAGAVALTRASNAIYRRKSDLKWVEVGNNVVRVEYDAAGNKLGLLSEISHTNKCTNNNFNPTVTTGFAVAAVSGSTPTPTLTVVDDATELATAGLDLLCTTGKVFKLDNSTGTGSGYCVPPGATGNTNAHWGSIWTRGGSGSIGNSTSIIDTGSVSFGSAAHYRRVMTTGMTPATTGDRMSISAGAGQVVYFILNQYEEAGVSSVIKVSGSAATRAADSYAFSDISWFDPHAGYFTAIFQLYVGSFTGQSREVFRVENTGNANATIGAHGDYAPAGTGRPRGVIGNGAGGQAFISADTTAPTSANQEKIVVSYTTGPTNTFFARKTGTGAGSVSTTTVAYPSPGVTRGFLALQLNGYLNTFTWTNAYLNSAATLAKVNTL